MSYTDYGGQQTCGKFDFKVGNIGANATHPQSGTPIPSSGPLPPDSNVKDYITGFTMKLQDDNERVRSINDVFTSNMYGQNKRLEYKIGYPNHNGTVRSFTCPDGYALSGMRVYGDKTTGRIKTYCRNLVTGKEISGPEYGSSRLDRMGGYRDLKCPSDKHLVTAIEGQFNQDSSGTSGDRLCSVRLKCADFSPEMHVLRTDEGKLGCCMGLLSPEICGRYYPQGASCESWMTDFCRRYPGAPECKCINSPIAKSKYNPVCVDADCIRTGYKPAGMLQARGVSCPPITDCSILFDIQGNYGNVNFADTTFEQKCSGTQQVGTTGQPPVYSPAETTKKKSGMSTGTIIALVAFVMFVVLGMIIGIVMAVSGEETAVATVEETPTVTPAV